MINKAKRISHHAVAITLAVLLLALLLYRLVSGDRAGGVRLPESSYYVDIVAEFSGHDGPVTIRMMKPSSDYRQRIFDEQTVTDGLSHSTRRVGENRVAVWEGTQVGGKRQVSYSFGVLTERRAFQIAEDFPIRQEIPDSARGDLVAQEFIQSGDSLVLALSRHLKLESETRLLPAIRKIYDYCTDTLKYLDYSGTTDAVTTIKLREASCGGKSRLFVALCRANGIPARLVGGKILRSGTNKTMHLWAEAWVNGWWVPFCPTNHYFAEIPAHYIKLYVDDEPFLTHTEDVNFQYNVFVKTRLVSRDDIQLNKVQTDIPGKLDLWAVFRRAAVSVELLRIILMLPLGALAVVIFRNIIGLQTFGTFMPALIAVAFRDTGLVWGVLTFTTVIILGLIVRAGLARLQLLHTPRLAIMLTIVIVLLLAVASAGSTLHIFNLARVSMFPMVIMTLTVERAAITAQESGPLTAIRVAISTGLVASITYLLMEPQVVQSIFVAYPEALLAVIVVNIYVGRYSGLRISELFRFRPLAMINNRETH